MELHTKQVLNCKFHTCSRFPFVNLLDYRQRTFSQHFFRRLWQESKLSSADQTDEKEQKFYGDEMVLMFLQDLHLSAHRRLAMKK